MSDLEAVIGVEIHVQLSTRTKMFCGCELSFGDPPNTHTCPVCLAHPGVLPVVNEEAVRRALVIGLALGCEIAPRSIFHRKNYFYPDLPKAYQISQFDIPICGRGEFVAIRDDGSELRVGITRAHLEEDAAKLTHAGGRRAGAEGSVVDFNRGGTPLVEIVTEPDLRSAADTAIFLRQLRQTLLFLDVSDCSMEEGSMRVDANVSVRRPGEALGTRCEIKNLNSVRSLGRAVDYEARRQIALLEAGDPVRQETRHWDENDGRTHTLRSKEDADDYRYFLEPDLVPLAPDQAWIDDVRASLPPLPAERRRRVAEMTSAAPDSEPVMVVVDRAQDAYLAEVVAAGADAGRALIHIKEAFAEQGPTPSVPAASLAALIGMETRGEVTATQAKQVLAEMVTGGGDPAEIAAARGFEAMDTGELESFVDDAIAAQPEAWAKYCAGEDKAAGALVGAIMKASRGQADGKAVTALLQSRRA